MRQRKRRRALNWKRLGTTKQEQERVRLKQDCAKKRVEIRAQYDSLNANIEFKQDGRVCARTKLSTNCDNRLPGPAKCAICNPSGKL